MHFRHHHIVSILKSYQQQKLPLDLFLKDYFKIHKAIGSKDRSFISETVYTMIRWNGLLDYLCGESSDCEKRLETYLHWDLATLKQQAEIPLHIRAGFPKRLFDLISASHGLEKGLEICHNSNMMAPITVRANILKTTREYLLNTWKDKYSVSPCLYSKHGIIFEKRLNFFDLPEFKQGLFEIQDEGSQLLSELVRAQPGQLVLDFCAGSGGKTLAFAPKMQNKGQIYLHDIRIHALNDAKKRLRRAGIQNAQIIEPENPNLKKLKKKMDWVLVDAPCTGTGTLRRNPDMKWKFNEQLLKEMISLQRVIFERALSYLKPDGFIIYATCSLLNEENKDQIDHLKKTYNLTVENIFQSTPLAGGMDGFFGAVIKKS